MGLVEANFVELGRLVEENHGEGLWEQSRLPLSAVLPITVSVIGAVEGIVRRGLAGEAKRKLFSSKMTSRDMNTV